MAPRSAQITKTRKKTPANLTAEAYNDIRRMIFVNELRPGQKVAYRDMAKRLGMSLTPVVQALKHMEFLGLLIHEPNRGFFVKPIKAEEVREVYELREVLELHLLPKIIQRLDEERLGRIRAALDDYLAASRNGSPKLRQAKDMQFHLILAEVAGEPLTERILKLVLDFLYLRFEPEMIFSRPQEKADREHELIFKALAARDAAAVCKAMRRHIRSVRDNALKGIQIRLAEEEEIDI
jgi:DNA-binding GntR family transcriptional regulator